MKNTNAARLSAGDARVTPKQLETHEFDSLKNVFSLKNYQSVKKPEPAENKYLTDLIAQKERSLAFDGKNEIRSSSTGKFERPVVRGNSADVQKRKPPPRHRYYTDDLCQALNKTSALNRIEKIRIEHFAELIKKFAYLIKEKIHLK